jgi:hypothetical protein
VRRHSSERRVGLGGVADLDIVVDAGGFRECGRRVDANAGNGCVLDGCTSLASTNPLRIRTVSLLVTRSVHK